MSAGFIVVRYTKGLQHSETMEEGRLTLDLNESDVGPLCTGPV